MDFAFPQDGWAATTLSADGKPVTCEKTLVIAPHHSYESAPALDVLVHPGGDGNDHMLTDEVLLEWLRQQRDSMPLVTSVCTGATALAATGLLRGRPATTNHQGLHHLAALDPTIEVRHGERYVDDGDVITSGGLSAGIDMALHIVGRLASPERSARVRAGIEYAPEPPH